MAETFRPYPLSAVLASAVVLGLGNAVLVLVPTATISLASDAHRISVGLCVGTAVATGLAGSTLIALFDRPMTYAQRTNGPHGLGVALNHLLAPALSGAVCARTLCGEAWTVAGCACGVLGFLGQFFILTPWKKTYDDADMEARTEEFGVVTRRYLQEYKDDLRDLSQRKAQRKYEKNQERLAR